MNDDKHASTVVLTVSLIFAVAAVGAAIVSGVLYYESTLVNDQPQAVVQIESPTQVMATLLRNSPVSASQNEIDNMASQLKNLPASATDAQKQAMVKTLVEVQ
jgi:predicted PurR-regulated permease PerM